MVKLLRLQSWGGASPLPHPPPLGRLRLPRISPRNFNSWFFLLPFSSLCPAGSIESPVHKLSVRSTSKPVVINLLIVRELVRYIQLAVSTCCATPLDKEHNCMVRNERWSPEITKILTPFHFIPTWIVRHTFFDGHLIQYDCADFWRSWEVCHFHAECLEYVDVETRICMWTNYVSLLVSDSATLSLAPELWKWCTLALYWHIYSL